MVFIHFICKRRGEVGAGWPSRKGLERKKKEVERRSEEKKNAVQQMVRRVTKKT